MASTCATNACGFVCTSTRAEHVDEHAEPALEARTDEPAHAVVHEPGHAPLVDHVRPLGQQLSPPLVVLARGARERRASGPARGGARQDLRDHPAHRRADHVGPLDALGVQHRDRVLGHAGEVVGAGRRVGMARAPVVGGDAAVATAEGASLERPAAAVDAETLDQQDGRAVATTPRAVRDVGAIVGDRRRHDPRIPAPVRATAEARRHGTRAGRRRPGASRR